MSTGELITLILGAGGLLGGGTLAAWWTRKGAKESLTLTGFEKAFAVMRESIEEMDARIGRLERDLISERDYTSILIQHIWDGKPPPPPLRPMPHTTPEGHG